jgi:hypothetical protein
MALPTQASTFPALWMTLGAPVGTVLYSNYGFFAIALATTLLPLATASPNLFGRIVTIAGWGSKTRRQK